MKKRFFVVAAVIVSSQLCTASHGQAQLVPTLREDTTGRSLDEVILTSNKYPKKQSESF